MEYLCSSSSVPDTGQSNRTFLESLQSMTDCTFSFLQLVINCLFIYSISLILIYRIYCARKCGATSESRLSKLIKSRRRHEKKSDDDTSSNKNAIQTAISKAHRKRNSKSFCSNVSDNVFEPNLRTISETDSANKYHVVALEGDQNYEVEYHFSDDLDNVNTKLKPEDIFELEEEPKDNSRQLLLHHIPIWIATLVFILIVSAQFAETIIVILTYWTHHVPSLYAKFESGANHSVHAGAGSSEGGSGSRSIPAIYYLRLFAALSSLISLSWSLLLFQHVETTRSLKYLWINIIYYIVATAFAILYLHFYFYNLQLTFDYLKIGVNLLSLVNGLILIVILFHTFLRERRVLKSLADKTLQNVKYLHYHTSILSRLVFFWFTEILHTGYKRHLEGEDLGLLPPEEKTQHQFERFNRVYEAEREECENSEPKKEFSLWKCLFKTLGSSLAISGFFRLLADLTGFVAPLGIRTIVRYVGSNTTSIDDFTEHMTILDVFSNGYVMAFVILLSAIFQSTFSQCSTFLVNSEGIHIKVALQALIYKKSLTLSPTKTSASSANLSEDEPLRSSKRRKSHSNHSSLHKNDDESNSLHSSNNQASGFDTGSILNILSEDTNNIMMFFWMVNFIWAIPLKLTILMGLLYLQLGYSALIGAGICILVMIPLQFYLGKKMSSNSKELMEKCDERLRSMSEILQGMKLLKLQGWELMFGQQIISIREKELKTLDRDLLYRSIMTFLTHISSVIVTVVTFGLYSYIETDKLEPSKVFAGLALFNQLTVPLFIFPITVPVVIDALVSARRVREFLLMPEAVSYTIICDDETNGSDTNSNHQLLDDQSVKRKKVPSLTIEIPNVSPQSFPPPPPSAKSLKLPRISDIEASTDSVFAPIAEEGEDEEESDAGADADDAIEPPLTIENIFDIQDEDIQPVIIEKKCKSSEHTNSTSNTDTPINKLDDLTKPTDLKLDFIDEDEFDSIISIAKGEFSWEDDRHDQTLTSIDVRIPSKSLTILVGKTGSGKSSFVSALLGEMRKFNGELHWKRDSRIAYAAQKPWILNGTVKENILFGKSFKSRRYKKVIDACSLQPDIDILPARENTEIGEKGINLSGGQKQRIAIARALYSNADVVILDDPLSALDVEVAHHVFNSGIRNFLVKKSQRTVILVTHHLPVLPHAHQIIAMEKGRIRALGTYKQIETSDPKLFADWKRIMSKKKEELQNKKGSKTATERWSLVRNIHKVVAAAAATKSKAASSVSWTTDEEKKWERYKKKKEIFSHHKTLSHEYRPGDECYYEEIMEPLLCHHRQVSRQSKESRGSTSSYTKTHPPLSRMTSLQVETKGRSPAVKDKIQRLQSLPVDEEPVPSGIRPRTGTNDSAMAMLNAKVKRKFFAKKQVSSTGSSSAATEMEKIQTQASQRLVSTISADTEELPEDEPDEDTLLMSRESSQDEREYGLIPPRVYLTYISACGHFLSSFYVLIAIGYEVVHVYTNFWLKEWSDEVGRSPDYQYDDIMSHYFLIYVILSIITVLVSLTSNIVGKQAGANSRRKLHSQMFDCIIRCPVRFFDNTPIGRILNRFASDMAVVDRKLCVSIQRFLQFVFLCISAIVVNAIVNPWFLIVAIPIVIIYYGLQRFYRFSSRELHRIEAISRGPIFSHFHETLEGLSTIRAYGVQRRFTNQMLVTIDVNNMAAMFINCGNRWLSISLDYLGSVIVFMATFVSMVSSHLHPDVVTPSMVGLAINYTLLVPIYLNHVVKFLAEVEMFMNSVDRIDRFSKHEVEDYGEQHAANVPATWPAKGEVVFDNVSARYSASGPLIINNLSAKISSEQKVGICGRSGSGKSSLLMALFRISEISSGKIEIDGIDVKKIPLLKLRSGIAMIPQENILFSGTLRFNLDPQNKFSDSDIWRALELCQMKFIIQDMPGQLDTDVKDGGSGFSAGQKQLLGLARAILHKTKLIIMDEATSSVDLATETTLLQVVSDAFKDSTVLTIAHRLSTITGGDRILVLDAGRIIEDGAPNVLMGLPFGFFATMLKNSNE